MDNIHYLRARDIRKCVPDVETEDPKILEDITTGEVYIATKHKDGWRIEISHDNWRRYHEFASELELEQAFEIITEVDYDAHVKKGTEELKGLTAEKLVILKDLQATDHKALTSGEPAVETSETLALNRKISPAGQLRNKAFAFKKRIETLQTRVTAKYALIESQVQAKLAAMQPALDELHQMVAQLEETILRVVLYLGREEEITVLRTGKKAPTETPISIRQTVGFMDEEIALEEDHGIDFTEIEKFDEWLLKDPKNLDSILPEQKGVVVLQVRRNDKDYGANTEGAEAATVIAAAIKAAEMNSENHKTYWLIRSGENLHRMWTNIHVGPRLIPLPNELDEHFYDSFRKEAILPGSEGYYEAMKKANEHSRHYMRLALVLQGLLDRTRLFKPHPEGIQRVNLMDQQSWGTLIVAVRDSEGKLHDGRPDFNDWLRKINGKARHGQRVAGNFYQSLSRDADKRTTSRHSPGSGIFTLLDTPEGSAYPFKILFPRGEIEKYDYFKGWTMVDSKRAASFLIDRSDRFICIDNAEVEDMQYYLTDRKSRKSYEFMIPLLKDAIRLKKEEAQKEEPFLELLLRKLGEAYPKDPCSKEDLKRLVSWWKSKTKEHRALTADDAKAYKMIVAEYGHQAEKPSERKAHIVTALGTIARIPDTIAAWYQGNGFFMVAREAENNKFFVIQEIWRIIKGTPVSIETQYWILPQKDSYLRWPQIFTTPDWEERHPAPKPSDFLAPIHDAEIIESGMECSKEEKKPILCIYASGRNVLLTLYSESEHNSHWRDDGKDYRAAWKARKPTAKLPYPSFNDRELAWKHTKETLEFRWKWSHYGRTSIDHYGHLQLGWEKESSKDDINDVRVIYLNTELLEKIKATVAEAKAHNDLADSYYEWTQACHSYAVTFLKKQWTEQELAKYTAEDGDPEFFEDHLKTVPKPKFPFRFSDVLERAIEKFGIEAVSGKLFAEIRKLVGPIRKKADDDDDENDKATVACIGALIKAGWRTPRYNKRGKYKEDESDED